MERGWRDGARLSRRGHATSGAYLRANPVFPCFTRPAPPSLQDQKRRNFGQKTRNGVLERKKKRMRGFWAFVESLPFHVSLLPPAAKRSFVQRSGKGTARKAGPDNRVLSGTGRWSQDWGEPLLFVPDRSAPLIDAFGGGRFVVGRSDSLHLETGSSPPRIIRKPWNLFRTEPCIAKN